MTAKEYATTLKGKSITAAYIGPLRLLQNAEMDSTYLPEVIEDPERDRVYYTGNLVKPDAASGLRPYVLIQPYTIVASRDDLCKHGLDYIMCAPEEYSTCCLMSNHVHLMLKLRQADRTSTAALSQCLKIIETRYAAYYNSTYEREGPLFTGRFASEPIEDEHYLLAAWCYVLRNPAKAGIAETDTYTWSSYSDYFGSGHPFPAVDTSYMLTRYSRDFLLQQIGSLDDPDGILEPPTPKKKCSDTDVVAKMDRICGCTTPSAFQTLSQEIRARSLAVLVQQGAGVRQLARLTGIAPGMISRSVRNYNTTLVCCLSASTSVSLCASHIIRWRKCHPQRPPMPLLQSASTRSHIIRLSLPVGSRPCANA